MCAIYLTNLDLRLGKHEQQLLFNRGPDAQTRHSLNGLNFEHYLLNVTGKVTPQPHFSEELVTMFNGEIYNYNSISDYPSEVSMLSDMYVQHSYDFGHFLDGEYAVCITDFSRKELILLTDIFGTKPLYYAIQGEAFGICSYKEPLVNLGFEKITRIHPNTMVVLGLEDLSIKSVKDYHSFCLKQTKNTFEDWFNAFERAVAKRFQNIQYDVILPLSSGHDSGAIACAMERQGITYNSYTYWGYEHQEVLALRLERLQNDQILRYEYAREIDGEILKRMTNEDRNIALEAIKERCSHFFYGRDLNENNALKSGWNDIGSIGLAHLLGFIKREKPSTKILASGQGGDEIMGTLPTYKFGEANPAQFPDDLSTVFPWDNFYLGAQSSYLSRDESISGGFGIEGRYPLLDKNLVQEFLWLSADLKNKKYKAPLAAYMDEHVYPYVNKGEAKAIKRGFNV